MLSKKFISIFAFVLLSLGLASAPARAVCPTPTWSNTIPPVNQRHIFCGEVNGGAAKGYHSKVYPPPVDVVVSTQNETPPVNGIYNGRVNFSFNGNAYNKNSTFFPDACSQVEIIQSVLYASAHPLVPQPGVPWGIVGPSAPHNGAAGYCLGTNGNLFDIRYATLPNGNINTAFPF